VLPLLDTFRTADWGKNIRKD